MNEFIEWLKAWEKEYKDELTYCPESGKAERIKQLERISAALMLHKAFTEGWAVWPVVAGLAKGAELPRQKRREK